MIQVPVTEPMKAINEIRKVTKHQCLISGISAIVTDTKDLAEQETPVYVCVAVVISIILLSLLMDSFMIPVFLPFEYWYGYSL